MPVVGSMITGLNCLEFQSCGNPQNNQQNWVVRTIPEWSLYDGLLLVCPHYQQIKHQEQWKKMVPG